MSGFGKLNGAAPGYTHHLEVDVEAMEFFAKGKHRMARMVLLPNPVSSYRLYTRLMDEKGKTWGAERR